MFGSTNHSSDNFWSNSEHFLSTSKNKRNDPPSLKEYRSSIDESPDFYDPYSDLNLFLSQKIKQEMQHCGTSKKWSLKIQEDLISKISPDFKQQFPNYRLGVSALKKTWEKVAYYSQQIAHEKEAIGKDGKLNVDFFIKQNLKNYNKSSSHLHPSHYALQVATKMSECIATVDGVRPKLEYLTKMIWSNQRHLLNGTLPKSPYDEYDQIDKLIVKIILEITAKEQQVSHQELETKVKEILHSLHELPSFSSVDLLTSNISALLAEKLYPTAPFHVLFFEEQKHAMTHFIKRHSSLCKTAAHLPQFAEVARRITALYTLASHLPKEITKEQLNSAVRSIYPTLQYTRPDMPQALYAFISAELQLMPREEYCHSIDYVCDSLWSAYKEASLLPQVKDDIIEILFWKFLSETEGLLEKLPYRIGQRIEEEIANILIDNPKQNFSSLVLATAQFFKRTKELVQVKKFSEIERKIHTWVTQGDMLCRWIRVSDQSTLVDLICKRWKEKTILPTHGQFVSEICQEYLKENPQLTMYAGQLSLRVWTLYKYAWYALFSTTEESSYDRFLKWHALSFRTVVPQFSRDHLLKQLKETVQKALPLIPFIESKCDSILGALTTTSPK